MAITINSNISSLRAQRQLASATDLNSKVQARLSSGLRINSASDDAAGLAVSSSLKADTRIYTQAIRNVSDGVSVLNIAQGSLEALSDIVIRQKELVEQAANGVYSIQQRKALHNEADALTKEFNRVVATTKFNGETLFSDPQNNRSIQIGSGEGASIDLNLGKYLSRAIGDGTFGSIITYSVGSVGSNDVEFADIDGDGRSDLVVGGFSGVAIRLGNGDGTFKATQSVAGDFAELKIADLNGDGRMDIIGAGNSYGVAVAVNNGNGSFGSSVSYAVGTGEHDRPQLADINGDGRLDIITANADSKTINFLIGRGDGTFQANTSLQFSVAPGHVVSGDLNNDGKIDLVVGFPGPTATLFAGNGDGTFRIASSFNIAGVDYQSEIVDINEDGHADVIYTGLNGVAGQTGILLGGGDGTLRQGQVFDPTPGRSYFSLTARDVNGDGFTDIINSGDGPNGVNVYLNNGDSSFQAVRFTANGALANTRGLGIGDINSDGVDDVVTTDFGSNEAYVALGNSHLSATQAHLYLLTQVGARNALTTLDKTAERISFEIGNVGALQSRLAIAASNSRTLIENYTGAASRITDADVAQESATLIRSGILQQAAASVLAQANQQPQIALQLLRN